MGDDLATVFEARACAVGNVKNMRVGGSTRTALALAELCYRTLLEDGVEALAAATARSVHNGLSVCPETRPFLHGEKVAFGTLIHLVLDGQERKQVEEVLRFSSSLGLPVTLAEVGLADPDDPTLDAIAVRATAAGETIHNEPFPVTPGMVARAIREADAIGRAWRAVPASSSVRGQLSPATTFFVRFRGAAPSPFFAKGARFFAFGAVPVPRCTSRIAASSVLPALSS
jgi:glycerol dehydrogenase